MEPTASQLVQDAPAWEDKETGAIMVEPHDALAVLEGRLGTPLSLSFRTNTPRSVKAETTGPWVGKGAVASSADAVAAKVGPPNQLHFGVQAEVLPLPDQSADKKRETEAVAPLSTVTASVAGDSKHQLSTHLSPLPKANLLNSVSPLTMLMNEGGNLVEHLQFKEGQCLLDAVMRGKSPSASAVSSRLGTPQGEADSSKRQGQKKETLLSPFRPLDRLILEAEELAQRLPDEHVTDLLTAIERGRTPVAQAVRSRVQTTLLGNQGHDDVSLMHEKSVPFCVPTLDLDRANLKSTADAVVAVLSERSSTALRILEEQGLQLMEQLDLESRSDISVTLAELSNTNSIASLLISGMLHGGVVMNGRADLSDSPEVGEHVLQDLVDDTSLVLMAVDEAIHTSGGMEAKSSILVTLHEMAGSEGQGSFVARMLYWDLLISCQSINGSMSDRSRKQFGELVGQGKKLVQQLEEHNVDSVLHAVGGGAAASSPLASVLYLHLLLGVDVDAQQGLRPLLRNLLRQCRHSLRQLFGDSSLEDGGASSSNASSRPQSRAAPRRRFRDTRTPRTKAMETWVDCTVDEVVLDLVMQEVAELCHQKLRTCLAQWTWRLNESKKGVNEIQDIISVEERANVLRKTLHSEEDEVDESSSAPPGTFYTFKLCQQGDPEVVSSVRLDADTHWAGFRDAVQEKLGIKISSVRYDDDFGPKQSKDIFCSNKSEWKELRDMMEEDKDEIRGVLTLEVFSEVKSTTGYRVKLPFEEEGTPIGIEDLNEMLSTCSLELQTAQMSVFEYKRRLKASWKYLSASEDDSLRQLQAAVRAIGIRRAVCRTRELVLFASHIFRPPILRYWQLLRWKTRHTISAMKLQSAFRGRQARKWAYLATVEVAARTILIDAATGMMFSVAEEERAMHKEWIIVDATNAARDFQRFIRLKLGPSLGAIMAQFEKEDKASYFIVRFFRAIRRRKRFFCSAIAAVTTEEVLFGPAMERAYKELLKHGKAQHMQAVIRRIAVQDALGGLVTSASDELACTFAMQDIVMWVLESQDELYEGPRRNHATTWLQAFARRRSTGEHYGRTYKTALMFQTTSRRRWNQLGWRVQYDSIKTLSSSLVRQKHTNWHNKLYYTACRVQVRARAMRLVYATRRFKRMVDHLVDIARANLYRRFYVHALLVGDRQTSQLRMIAESADFERDQRAANERDARRREEADKLAEEARKKRGGRRSSGEMGQSESLTGISRMSSADKLDLIRKRGEEARKQSRSPAEMIFTGSPRDAMEATIDFMNEFLKDMAMMAQRSDAPDDAAAGDAESQTVDGIGGVNDSEEGMKEYPSLRRFWASDTYMKSLQDYCQIQLRKFQLHKVDERHTRQHIIFWLQRNFDDLSNRWRECEDGSYVVLEVLDSLLNSWSQRTWINHPGFLPQEVDNFKSVFECYFKLLKAAMPKFVNMQKQFPNVATAAALLQSLQDSCADAIADCNKDGMHAPRKNQNRKYVDDDESADDASYIVQLKLVLRWLNEEQDDFFLRVDKSYSCDSLFAFWAAVLTDFIRYCYRVKNLTATLPLSLDEFTGNIQRYAKEFDSDYDAIEAPYQTYDGLWTMIFAGQDDYMDTTKEFTWTPEGYALNASSGELVPVDVPDTKNIKSIYSAVLQLSWKFEREMSLKLLPGMRHIHPVGFLGALSARRRRDRVHMWTALAIETTVCKFLNYAIRIAEGQSFITVLRVFTILCLRPGRGTLLFQLGCVKLLNSRIVGGNDIAEVELSSAAAFALQSLLSDAYVSSKVDVETVNEIAEQLQHPVHGTMHVSVVYCLQLIVRNNEPCKMELAHQTWLHGILLQLIRKKNGPEGLVASVAMLIAMLSYDADVARLFGEDPETISELILMLRDANDIVSRQSALTAISSLGLSQENVDIMIQHPAFHNTLMDILATQSLQLFPLSANLAVRFVKNAKMCNATMQFPKVLNALLHSMTFSDVRISAPATEVLMALTSSIEKAWLLANSSKQPELKDLQNLVVAAGQVEQFGVNSFAMSTICQGMVSSYPVSQPYAARALRSILRCSITACDWVLKNEDAMQCILDGVRHRDETVQEYCIWSIHDLSARNKGAAMLVKRGGFVRLKVLLYTDVRNKAKVAVIRSLKHFLLGLDRVAGPDEELIRRITELLRSDDEQVQDACAEILSQMIQQDYIDLFVKVYGASNCPQSDNWGYCDPFVKLKINGQEHKTPTLRNTLNPVWNYDCHFSISDKSDNLKVELYDWDNAGDEVLGEIELSCDKLHELGTELGLYRVGRALSEKATSLRNEAEQKASTILEEIRSQSVMLKQNGHDEATNVRDELLEEARFIGSDAKAEAKQILDEAAIKAKAVMAQAEGQSRQLQFRAEQQAQKLKEEAKKRSKQVQKVWGNKTKDIADIPERIMQLEKQARSKYDRICKDTSEEADRMLLRAIKQSQKIRMESSEEAERILSLKDGWHIVMERDRDELTGHELMGFKGEISGFDDKGRVRGPGGKELERSPTVLNIKFEYCINVNVDRIIFDQSWIIGRLFDLLALEARQQLCENVLVVMRALTEDVPESRLAIGQHEGGLELLSRIFATPGLDSCYVEICKLVAQLLFEPTNRMPIYKSPLMGQLKSLLRWKGSVVAAIARENLARLERHADRVRKAEKQQKKQDRQVEAVNRHKKASPAGSPSTRSPRSPNPEQSQESRSTHTSPRKEAAQSDRHRRRSSVQLPGSPSQDAPGFSVPSNQDWSEEPGPLQVFTCRKTEEELEEEADENYGDPDYM